MYIASEKNKDSAELLRCFCENIRARKCKITRYSIQTEIFVLVCDATPLNLTKDKYGSSQASTAREIVVKYS